jgi:hypothetical protein
LTDCSGRNEPRQKESTGQRTQRNANLSPFYKEAASLWQWCSGVSHSVAYEEIPGRAGAVFSTRLDGNIRGNGGNLVLDMPVGDAYRMVATCDFNGDNENDILWRHQFTHEMAVWYVKNGVFASGAALGIRLPPSPQNGVDGWKFVACGKFNGRADSASILLQSVNEGRLAFWQLNGASGFVPGVTRVTDFVVPGWRPTDVYDVDGDLSEDIVVVGPNNVVGYWKMAGHNIVGGVAANVSCGQSVMSYGANPGSMGDFHARVTDGNGRLEFSLGFTAVGFDSAYPSLQSPLPAGHSAASICGRATVTPGVITDCRGFYCR